jgi:hypothetical protein
MPRELGGTGSGARIRHWHDGLAVNAEGQSAPGQPFDKRIADASLPLRPARAALSPRFS